ncbi:MAG: flagellar hook-associated protein FlgL [Rubrivivax sp.]|nr:flagellar hook-associated protein FlgL [Rubrivivax sp.]
MRITTANAYDTQLSNLQRRQQSLTDAQDRLTSGKRVLRASDDPAAAAVAERALATEARAVAQQRALDASRNAMQLSETAIGDAGEVLQQARELIVAAGNGSYTDAERKTVATAIRGLRDDLLAVANRGDGAGRYLFGGQGGNGLPLLDNPGGVTYNASAGQLMAASGEASPLSIDGRAAFLQAPDPTNAGAVLSVFDVLDRVVGELSTAGRTGAQIAQTVGQGLGEVDALSGNLSATRARAGETLKRIDGIELRLSQTKLDAQRERSDAEDLDMLQAISDFKNKQTGYDAALQTYALVQKMSLFDYLR